MADDDRTAKSDASGVKAFVREHLHEAYPQSFTLRDLAEAYIGRHSPSDEIERAAGMAAVIPPVSEALSELEDENVVCRVDGGAVAGDDTRYRLQVWQ